MEIEMKMKKAFYSKLYYFQNILYVIA